MKSRDFQKLNKKLLANSRQHLQRWLPHGVFRGSEYVSRNPKRDDKNFGSFSINSETGRWADFAVDVSGGDLISLFAYLNDLSQTTAAKNLKRQIGE